MLRGLQFEQVGLGSLKRQTPADIDAPEDGRLVQELNAIGDEALRYGVRVAA